jgi:hypothetical protein
MQVYKKLSDALLRSGVVMPPEFLRNVIISAGLKLAETGKDSIASPISHLEQHHKLSMQGWVE